METLEKKKTVVKQEKPKLEKSSDEWKDCFTALFMALLGEFFLSGDTKYFIIQGMFSKLEAAGYTEEQIDHFRVMVSEVYEKYNQTNSFMG